jgi:general stress protein CsbA
MESRSIPRLLRVWRVVSALNMPAFMVGGFAGLTGHRWAAYVLIANFVTQIGFHLMVGARAYQDVMTKAWPTVVPLADDDDWDE